MKCEKCGNPLPESGVCTVCAASSENVFVQPEQEPNDVWMRPGSSGSVRPDAERPVSDSNADDPSASAKSGDVKINDDGTDDGVKAAAPTRTLAESQIGTAEQRAAYFNAIAGVDEQPVDEQFYVSETSLFDVPFNDTVENLGFNFPKFRQVMSKKTKKKMRIGGGLTAVLAMCIVAVIALGNYFNIGFSVFGSTPDVPVIYSYDSSVYLTDSKGTIPADIRYADRRATLSSPVNIDGEKIERLAFSPDYRRMFTIESYESVDSVYSLYERETKSSSWRETQSNGNLVDKNICTPYRLFYGSKALAYIKKNGDLRELCVYTFADSTARRIDSGVDSFCVLSDDKLLYVCENNLYMLTVSGKNESKSQLVTENVLSVVSAYEYGFTDRTDYYYVTFETNDDYGEYYTYNDGDLHLVSGESDKVIDSGVSRIVLPCFDNGTVYYYKDRYYSYSIGDLIEDDVAEEDAEFIREHGDNVDYYNMLLSDWQRYIRNNLRHMKTDDGNNISALEFAIESGIASDLWCFTDGKTAEIAKSVTDYIMRDSKNGLLIYYRRAINIEKIKFSEVEQSNIQSLQSLYYYCKDVLLPTEILRSSDICIGTSSVRLGDGFIRKAVCKKDGSSVCYMTTEKEKSEIGMLKCLSLSDIEKSEPTTVVDGITDFNVVGNAAISIDESKNLYYNSEKIAQSVDCWQSALDDSVVVFLADYNSGSGTGTLKSIENANVTTVAADIHDFAVYGGVVAYIGDYNKSEKKGTLYISSGIKAGKTTAIDASELIRY